jgi:hypothetical protein
MCRFYATTGNQQTLNRIAQQMFRPCGIHQIAQNKTLQSMPFHIYPCRLIENNRAKPSTTNRDGSVSLHSKDYFGTPLRVRNEHFKCCSTVVALATTLEMEEQNYIEERDGSHLVMSFLYFTILKQQ